MAVLRVCLALFLTLLLGSADARAADPQTDAPPGLFDRPVLVIDPGIHTNTIRSAAADAQGRWAVTGSYDKTVRVWSLADGALLLTIRLPAGPGELGQGRYVAMSPDGALIAVGGRTRWTEADPQEQIYLFDRATGALRQRIEGLTNIVSGLTFSPDGQLLAAMLSNKGLRIYARDRDWAEVARDDQYNWGSFHGVAFAPDGRLATTEFGGKVRVYAGPLIGDIRPTVTVAAPGGSRPWGIAFSPDGTRLAVGHNITPPAVDLLEGHTLAPLPRPNLGGIDDSFLTNVAWSTDGDTLFAASAINPDDTRQVLAWSDAGAGARRALPAGSGVIHYLVPLPGGDLLVAADGPWLARLQADGGARWVHGSPVADFTGQFHDLSVSSDGTQIDFGFARRGKIPARFDLKSLTLQFNPPHDGRTAPPRQDALKIKHWFLDRPTLAGKPLPLAMYDTSYSLAIHPFGDRLVLGSQALTAFDASGTQLWARPAPGLVWAVNITGDGRLVLAAYADGTIRWHRMADGVELLAFMPLSDRTNWVAWTPEGFYAATAGAHGILGWHVNRGWDPADRVAIEDIPGSYRPAVLPLVLQEMETPRALGLAALAEHNREIMIRTDSRLPPGTKLHLLAIGISGYNEDYAKNLRLQYADRDARDLASAITSTQRSLYADVKPQVLLDKDANRRGIMEALDAMRRHMAVGDGNDLAVVHFSGHGAMVDGKLYLLPYEVDARDDPSIKASGLEVGAFKDELLELAKYGRVLVLLDACHSGATTMDGAAIAIDADALRVSLAAANVTVLTSSKGSETSEESDTWQHGAFTKALLDAFNDPAADINHNGLISTTGLENYLMKRVPELTDGHQTPGMEVRFDTTLFASGS